MFINNIFNFKYLWQCHFNTVLKINNFLETMKSEKMSLLITLKFQVKLSSY